MLMVAHDPEAFSFVSQVVTLPGNPKMAGAA